MEEKNLQLERTVFFCDAVIAIAITLLALDIKIPHPANGHMEFSNLMDQWRMFAAFLLSFINIANFWRTHHSFYSHIKKMDERLLWYNIWWLFFIVTIPFSTTLLSTYFTDRAAVFSYCVNILMVTIFQNMIWDYASSVKPDFLKKETIDEQTIKILRLFCNLDMVNAVLAIVISFFKPTLAFILLFTKLPLILLARIYFKRMGITNPHEFKRGQKKEPDRPGSM